MAKVTYSKTVSDNNLHTVIQRIADLLKRDINVHSGDRSESQHIQGSPAGSLHNAHRAADFHISGMSDTDGFNFMRANMNNIFDQTEAYEVIQHRPGGETQGPHLHIGRYGAGRGGYIIFKMDGLEYGKHYHKTTVPFSTPNGTPVKPEQVANLGANAGANGSSAGIMESVGNSGKNQFNDVKLVQFLLNLAATKMTEAKINFQKYPKINENGVCGADTVQAIIIFQRDVVGLSKPDGRVDAGGRTLQMLYVAAYNPSDTILRRIHRAKVIIPKTRHSSGRESAGEALKLLGDPRIKAMLEVLALSEGTGNNYARVVFGLVKEAPYNPGWVGKHSNKSDSEGVIITDFSRHPRVIVQTHPGQPAKDWSSACGRYQFLRKTWDSLRLPSFERSNQDIGGVMLFQRRGMITPLLNGDFDAAIQNGCEEWASLPDKNKGGASHWGGQPSVPLPRLRAKYAEALKSFGG